jgi:hypothetical protein
MHWKELTIIVAQIAILFLYGFCTEYKDGTRFDTPPIVVGNIDRFDAFSIFTDVHGMIFIGFGFLMVFLKTLSWTAVGFTYIISVFVI